MIVITVPRIEKSQVDELLNKLGTEEGCAVFTDDRQRTVVSISRQISQEAILALEAYPWVERVITTESSYHLVARQENQATTAVRVGNQVVGGSILTVMAGPCAIEDYSQLKVLAKQIQASGANILRGGAYKPRTSPYAFQGLEMEGLIMLQSIGKELEMPVVSEILDPRQVEEAAPLVDLIQIGARNMYNTPLLKEVGKQEKPILLKRNASATYDEWLQAAEYIAASGNSRIILCERGIRTFESYTRNTLDLAAVPAIRHLSHLPIVVDPSHGTGRWRMVAPMAMAAVACGADGIMVEVHPSPESALSDGRQSLQPERFESLMQDLKKIMPVTGRVWEQKEEED